MKRKIEIELYEEHDKVNFYTLRFHDEETEFEKFLDTFAGNSKHFKDLQIIIQWLNKIAQNGALERYFRPEGKYTDGICAIPIDVCSLRIYVIRISDNIIVLGNGGAKDTATYNEDVHLNSCVKLLQEIEKYIKHRFKNNKVYIQDKQLLGELVFFI